MRSTLFAGGLCDTGVSSQALAREGSSRLLCCRFMHYLNRVILRLTAAEEPVQGVWIKPCSSAMTMAIQRDLTPNFRRMLQKW
ncbi:hypothetical protein PS850_00602 [Pseudomonas fluorescens]|nr:hypothetical protein PS850_00602 [Pseudomonas fluorescens]